MSKTTDLQELPGEALTADRMPGHWLLARLGKRVLRPGGVEMTTQLLDDVAVSARDDLVEVAPGLGATTRLLLADGPATYTGVDREPAATDLVAAMLEGPGRRVIQASAADTGLPDASADVVFGEAYLTMQPDSLKGRVVTELARVLRPGGRFALHEVAFSPDDIDEPARGRVAADLTSSIKVSVNPLTVSAWRGLLEAHGLVVRRTFTSPLHLLEPRRIVADEGFSGAARFVTNVARDATARRRVLAMRSAMSSNAGHLQAVGMVAERPGR